jgi:hypothetical protein
MVKRLWAILIAGLTIFPAFPTVLRARQATSESTPSLIAEVRQRIDTDRLEVRVYQGRKLVQLPRFMELFVVTPLPKLSQTMETLTNRSVAIVRSEKNPDRWEVYLDVWVGTGGADMLTLAGNVFKVKQVIISSSQSLLELRLDEKIVQIKPGDALLVL